MYHYRTAVYGQERKTLLISGGQQKGDALTWRATLRRGRIERTDATPSVSLRIGSARPSIRKISVRGSALQNLADGGDGVPVVGGGGNAEMFFAGGIDRPEEY